MEFKQVASINEEVKEKVILNHDLQENFAKCKLPHLQILKLVYYQNMPIIFKEIYEKLKIIGTDKTLRNKIDDLESWGFLDIIHSRILIISPKIERKAEIESLIKRQSTSLGELF